MGMGIDETWQDGLILKIENFCGFSGACRDLAYRPDGYDFTALDADSFRPGSLIDNGNYFLYIY